MYKKVIVHQVTKKFGSLHNPGQTRRFGLPAFAAGQTPLAQQTPLIAVEQVSFAVEQGQIFGILGPEGAGKSTLLQMVAALLAPDYGSIEVFGYDAVRQAAQIRRLTNRLSTSASFFKKLSPVDNLLYNARYYGLNDGRTRRQAEEVLARLGLGRETAQAPIETLPHNLQALISIAQTLISQPALLLLDEPTIGLAEAEKQQVYRALREQSAERGATILLTMQDWHEARQICDGFIWLENGRIAAASDPAALLALQPDPCLEGSGSTFSASSCADLPHAI